MLKETIYSSLFILASKRNRVRVGYEKDWLCARLALRAHSSILFTARLVEPKNPTSATKNHVNGFCFSCLFIPTFKRNQTQVRHEVLVLCGVGVASMWFTPFSVRS